MRRSPATGDAAWRGARENPSVTPHRWDTTRVEAFSDGVFAIAITLLVLEISVAPEDFDHLRRALLNEWPAYLAYVTSFLTVGSVWIAHHNLFTQLRYVDAWLLRINLLLLMAAAFLPFPTAVLAQALHHSDEAERVAIVLYGGTALVIELLLRSAVSYALSQPELTHAEPSEAPAEKRRRNWREAVTASAYGLAILAGIFIFPKLAAGAYLVVAIRGVLVIGGEGRLSLRGLGPG
jgi:TMEM175 potassium channel family protein